MATPIAKDYVAKFEKLGLGMFVHFGLYSLVGKGEWAGRLGKEKEEDYRKLPEKFNPQNIKDIVDTAKSAGAKYIVFTTRHHDGFSLYDTKGLSDFDVMHSAAKRDIVEEFVAECRKQDIIPFFYHTTIEFWNKDYDEDFEKYLNYLNKSVELLCTNYGEIGGLWFDGNWAKDNDAWDEDGLYGIIRSNQPNAIITNNTGLSKLGEEGHHEIDSVTFERGRAFPLDREGKKKYLAGEACNSVNNHWGLAQDVNYKSPAELIKELCACRKVGANFLINVGPDADGTVPPYPKATMGVIGEWIKIFGEAIYEPKPYWCRQDEKNFVLKNGNTLYLFCYELCRRGSENVVYAGGSEGVFTFEGLEADIKEVHWMDNDECLEFSSENGNLSVNFTGYDYGYDYCVRVAKATLND